MIPEAWIRARAGNPGSLNVLHKHVRAPKQMYLILRCVSNGALENHDFESSQTVFVAKCQKIPVWPCTVKSDVPSIHKSFRCKMAINYRCHGVQGNSGFKHLQKFSLGIGGVGEGVGGGSGVQRLGGGARQPKRDVLNREKKEFGRSGLHWAGGGRPRKGWGGGGIP